MMATTFHRVRSSHPEDDAQGRVFGPGELVPNLDLTSKEFKEFNQRKVDEGIFYQVDSKDVEPDEIPASPGATLNATEAAARLADENQIDLNTLEGTGKDGRIIDADVEKAIADSEAAGSGEGESPEGED